MAAGQDNRDPLGLVVSVSELAARLTGSEDIASFLGQIVELVADHLHSDVCSIYLYDEQADELVLRATRGLRAEAVGSVRMHPGEGLTGLSLRELRPIREARASANPHFKAFSGIDEEPYESFLAVPILKGIQRIGVLVVQREQRAAFDEHDEMALRATASQLAGAVANARMLMDLRPAALASAVPRAALPGLIRGQVASPGLAFGTAVVIDPAREQHLFTERCYVQRFTLEDFHQARSRTVAALEELQENLGRRLPEVASMIFDAHILMLKDPAFVGEMARAIESGENPPEAVLRVGHKYMDLFAASPHEYIREKSHDVADLVKRLLSVLTGEGGELNVGGAESVLIARELYPSDMLKLAASNVEGIVLTSGGVTSHVAILARSLDVPMVIAREGRLLDLTDGVEVIVDAEAGNIHVQPGPEVIEGFRAREAARRALHAAPPAQEATRTADGTRIRLEANVNLLSDLPLACRARAEAVGLYRSEFPFLVRTVPPDESEQFAVYRKLIEGAPGREVTFRTLDLGGDKLLASYGLGSEENPALGLRSLRFCFQHEEVFDSQLRAILRAGRFARRLKIMYPMVASLEDFRRAKARTLACLEALPPDERVEDEALSIGMMIEVPAAVAIVEELAAEADFLCVGTNDLTQFLLAVDRTNEKVAAEFCPHHPAVVRSIDRTARAAETAGIEISACGEMAHETHYAPLLLGLGIRTLSVDPHYLQPVQQALEGWTLEQARALAADVRKETTLDGAARRLGLSQAEGCQAGSPPAGPAAE